MNCYREIIPDIYCDDCPWFQTNGCPEYNIEEISKDCVENVQGIKQDDE